MAGILEALLILFLWEKYGVTETDKKKKAVSIRRLLRPALLAAGCVIMNLLLWQSGYGAPEIVNRAVLYLLLVTIAGIDYKLQRIPNRLLLAGLLCRAATLLWEAAVSPQTWKLAAADALAGMLGGFLLLLLLSVITKHGIGYGDVKLFAWLGLCVGVLEGYYILFYSVLFTALTGAFLMFRKKTDRKGKLPFAPFVLAGYCAVFLMSYF